MKKTLLSITAVVLLFAGCNDKDNTTPNAGKWYISKSIEVGTNGNGNDTTLVSYNADNTVKEFYDTDGSYFYASTPVYQGGKIVRVEERSTERPTPGVRTSYEYNGDKLVRVNNFAYDATLGTWYQESYDSLVYDNAAKLSEVYDIRKDGYAMFFKLTWEGANVTKYERSAKVPGATVYTLESVGYNTYDAKPAIHLMMNNNYIWLVNVLNFENLSANNLVKQEVSRMPGNIFSEQTTIYLTYNEDGLVSDLDTKYEYMEMNPPHVENSKTLFVYTKR